MYKALIACRARKGTVWCWRSKRNRSSERTSCRSKWSIPYWMQYEGLTEICWSRYPMSPSQSNG